ncbi:MAG: universal stress protein [Deltaproteobacteria bacterium]|nr:universal stress protein [Deltaproteobacteria bacterium]MBW2360562.1 universal stress protein [Deltaproteobacteria bacterium]
MLKIRRIVVPTDFSADAAHAYEVATDLAGLLGAEITLLHCYQINPGGISPYGIVLPEKIDQELRDAALSQLDGWREKAAGDGVTVQTRLMSVAPSLGIASCVKELGADLIVMGTRGLSGIQHVLLGSVAERTVRTATCPVLTVKAPDAE